MNLAITSHPFADWFFPQVSLRVIKLYRMAVGLMVFLTSLIWLPNVYAWFTSAGYTPAAYVQQTTVYSKLSILFFYDAPWFVYICFGLLMLSSLAVIFGKGGRFSSILMYFMFISFASRFPLVFYGGIDMLHSALFFNMLHPADSYKSWRHGGSEERSRTVPAWSIRMIQLSLCLVYFFAGAQKVRSNTWWNGTEIIDSLSTRFGAFNFYWLTQYPIVINLMTYGSWLTELSFAFLVYNKTSHRFALFLVISMHIGIGLVMNASLFSEIMLACLIAFFTPEDEARLAYLWTMYKNKLQSWYRRSRLKSA